MTSHEKLDAVLTALSKVEHKYFEESHIIKDRLKFYIPDVELELLLEHLVFLDFATDKEVSSERRLMTPYTKYRITTQGLLFLEKSSFKSEINKGKRIAIWTIAKTIAAIANAIMIIIIGFASVYLAKQSNDDKIENKKLHRTIDSLTTVNKIFNNQMIDTLTLKDTSR